MVDNGRTRLVRCTCHFCGAAFFASRADAKFDAPACRMRAYRWRQKLPQAATEADKAMGVIWQYLDYPSSRDKAIEVLAYISREIDRGLIERGVKLTRVR